MSRNRIIIELQPERPDAEVRELKGLVKAMLRRTGWRCVRIAERDDHRDDLPPDRDLARVIDNWPALPAHLRASIVRLTTACPDDAAEVVELMRRNQRRTDAEAVRRMEGDTRSK